MEHSAAAPAAEVEATVMAMAIEGLHSRGLEALGVESISIEHTAECCGATIAAVVELLTMNGLSARTPAKPVGISGWGLYLPRRALSNDDLVALGCPIAADEIALKTGVLNRHVADENEALSDLAARASRRPQGCTQDDR